MRFKIPEEASDYAFFVDFTVFTSRIAQMLQEAGRSDLSLVLYDQVISESRRVPQMEAWSETINQWFLERVASAYYNRAVTHYRLRSHSSAEYDLDKVDAIYRDMGRRSSDATTELSMDEVLSAALSFRANLRMERDLLDKALVDADRILSAEPENIRAVAKSYLVRGQIFGKRGNSKEALSEYRKLLAIAGDQIIEQRKIAVEEAFDIIWHQAHAAQAERNVHLACQYYSAIIEMTDERPDLCALGLVNRGLIHLTAGELKLCILDCTAVVQEESFPELQRAKALVNRCQAQILVGCIDEAQSDIDTALGLLDPSERDWAISMVQLAQIHRMSGRYPDAANVLRSVLEQTGVDPGIRSIVEQMGLQWGFWSAEAPRRSQ